MKSALIIDDEPLARTIVRKFLSHHPEIEIIGECENGFEGLKAIESNRPDLIFLDIQMPKITRFEMLELVNGEIDVIFTTAFDEYAIKAFETSTIDYLLKPFTQERFDQAIEKWKKRHVSLPNDIHQIPNKQPDEHQRIVVRDANQAIKIIPTEDVFYIEAYDDYVKIHTRDHYFLKKKTMNYYEQTLKGSDFLRVHRSYIIHIKHLTGVESFEKNAYRATLTNGQHIPISRSYYKQLKLALNI